MKQLIDRHGSGRVEGVDSVAALLASGVDGVIIAGGTYAHPELILACVEAGLPALCEKPVAQNGAAGAELLRRLEGSTVPVQIGFQRRYDAAIAGARAAVVSGELGWITTVRSTTLDPEPPSPEYVAVSRVPFSSRTVVVFPAPLGPSSASTSPGSTSSVSPSSATPVGKLRVSSRVEIAGGT